MMFFERLTIFACLGFGPGLAWAQDSESVARRERSFWLRADGG